MSSQFYLASDEGLTIFRLMQCCVSFDRNHYWQWLTLDRKVLEQELPKTETLSLYLHVRYVQACTKAQKID